MLLKLFMIHAMPPSLKVKNKIYDVYDAYEIFDVYNINNIPNINNSYIECPLLNTYENNTITISDTHINTYTSNNIANIILNTWEITFLTINKIIYALFMFNLLIYLILTKNQKY